MSYPYDEDDWMDVYDEAISDIIDQGIKDLRDENVALYLGTFGDAVQVRINHCLRNAHNLTNDGYFSQSIISSFTAFELILRYYIILPILHGVFLSKEWANILIKRILSQRSADRKILSSVLRAWEIDLNSILLPDGTQLWSTFISELVPLRNNIVHKGEQASKKQGLHAIEYPETLLEEIIKPLSDRFGFSWSETGKWNPTIQGKGGAKSGRSFPHDDPFV